MEEIGSYSGPDQGYDAFRDHCSVEDRTSMTFTAHAACHQRALSCMKTGNGSTGNCDEHHREDGARLRLRMGILQSVPQFGQRRVVYIEHHQDTHRHEDKGHGEKRVNLADNLVDRQQGSQDVIDEDDDNPKGDVERLRRQAGQQSRG